MDPITRKLVETYTQMSEGILDSLYSKQKSFIKPKPTPGKISYDDLFGFGKKEPTAIIGGLKKWHSDIGGSKQADIDIPALLRALGDKKRQLTTQPVPNPKPAPTPGKTPYDDRAGDTSIDAANDPARGGQSGAWGGGAGTPAPEPNRYDKYKRTRSRSYDQDRIDNLRTSGKQTPASEPKPFPKISFDELEKLGARIKIPKQGPYYTQK